MARRDRRQEQGGSRGKGGRRNFPTAGHLLPIVNLQGGKGGKGGKEGGNKGGKDSHTKDTFVANPYNKGLSDFIIELHLILAITYVVREMWCSTRVIVHPVWGRREK